MSTFQELLERYTPEQQKIILDYWDVLRWTRQTGKIAEGIKCRELEFWRQYEPDVAIDALVIHMDKYPNIREHYTRGIMRNLAAEKSAATAQKYSSGVGGGTRPAPAKKNRFVNYSQRDDWDYEALEYLENLRLVGALDSIRDELKKNPKYARYLD